MPERAGALRHVVVSGSSGLIGRALVASLRADGIGVTRLVRHPPAAADEIAWPADAQRLDPDVLAGADAVVGLNGTSIRRLPWTRARRRDLLWSRLTPTRRLADAVAALGQDAPAFVSASATGYYGSAPGRVLDEHAPSGETFLATLTKAWEQAARTAGDHAPVARIRTAPVIHPDGVLAPLLPLVRAGLAGPVGPGTQAQPWISLVDEVRAIRHVLDQRWDGPVNLTGPTRAVAHDLVFPLAVRLQEPYLLRAPSWALRAVLGADAADSLLLADADVRPTVLESTGFTFTHTTVQEAIAAVVPAADQAA